MQIPDLSILAWIILSSLIGGTLSVAGAGIVAFKARSAAVPMLISYAIGAMLGAVFLEILPEAINATVRNGGSVQATTTTVLFGILLFFTLEKLVIWRHCHGDHCEVHAIHTEEDCPETHPEAAAKSSTKYKAVTVNKPSISVHAQNHAHDHSHDHGRSGMMVMIGDTFHNFVDGILIASAFMVDIKVGIVTSAAIIAHEIPQEVAISLFYCTLATAKNKRFCSIWYQVSLLLWAAPSLISHYNTCKLGRLQYWALPLLVCCMWR